MSLNKKDLPDSVVFRLVYVKCLYLSGARDAEEGTKIGLAQAIQNFDNSVELLMRTVIDYLGVKYDQDEWKFDVLLGKVRNNVNNGISNERAIVNIHQMRNFVHHSGIVPSHDQVYEFEYVVKEFLAKLIRQVFSLDFSDISMGELIKNNDVRELYKASEAAFFSGDYRKVLINGIAAFELAKNLERGALFGSGITRYRIRGTEDSQWPINYITALDEEVELFKLRLDYKKYQTYRQFFDDLRPLTSIKTAKEVEALIGNNLDSMPQNIQKERAKFCLEFAIESILRWESFARPSFIEMMLERVSRLEKS